MTQYLPALLEGKFSDLFLEFDNITGQRKPPDESKRKGNLTMGIKERKQGILMSID